MVRPGAEFTHQQKLPPGRCCQGAGGDDGDEVGKTTEPPSAVKENGGECVVESGVLIGNEGPAVSKRIKAVRLFVVTLLVSLMFVCAYMTLPQLACLCQIDTSEEADQEAGNNINRVIQSNQQCSEKLNRLSLELQENYEIRKRLQEALDLDRIIYIMALRQLKQVREENRRLVLQLQSKASFKLLESNEDEGNIHYQPYNLNNARTSFALENNENIEEDAPITSEHADAEKINKEDTEQ